MSEKATTAQRPSFPKKAVVTAGMPYGNKDLHFGHIGGVFIYADFWSRFLRDRIGKENVLFVSGTDGFGSPIAQAHQDLVQSESYHKDLESFVRDNHKLQKEILARYDIAIDRFDCSSEPATAALHQELSGEIFNRLLENGHLQKMATEQFYDDEAGIYLNGRQVLGKCPIQGCSSEKAYADECGLGHQYMPAELLFPKSAITGEKPQLKSVTNWFLDLPKFKDLIEGWTTAQNNGTKSRNFYIKNISEFFEPPIVHIKKDQADELEALRDQLPEFSIQEGQSKAIRAEFRDLAAREKACEILTASDIRYRTGKTLVPFRLTGNVAWGLPIPKVDDESSELTWWVWPESLIAPLSFTKAHLAEQSPDASWRDWWCNADCQSYQFIGEDNVYFYGIAETALFLGTQAAELSSITARPGSGEIQLPTLIVNNHLKFLDKKASSSSAIKPPLARELLDHYTSDQLRAHFISLGLGVRSVSFRPKPLDPKAPEKAGDPVLKEGNLLSNVFNRNLRSCFYTRQEYFKDGLPQLTVSSEIMDWCETAILKFEQHAVDGDYHFAMATLDKFIRETSKHWSKSSKAADEAEDEAARAQLLVDCFQLNRVATVLMHPIAPAGCEIVRDYYAIAAETFWSWDHILKPYTDILPAGHQFPELAPRFDFFSKHPSQIPSN